MNEDLKILCKKSISNRVSISQEDKDMFFKACDSVIGPVRQRQSLYEKRKSINSFIYPTSYAKFKRINLELQTSITTAKRVSDNLNTYKLFGEEIEEHDEELNEYLRDCKEWLTLLEEQKENCLKEGLTDKDLIYHEKSEIITDFFQSLNSSLGIEKMSYREYNTLVGDLLFIVNEAKKANILDNLINVCNDLQRKILIDLGIIKEITSEEKDNE